MNSEPPTSRPFKIDFGDSITQQPGSSDARSRTTAPAQDAPQDNGFAGLMRATPVTMIVMGVNLAIFVAMVVYSGGKAFISPSNVFLVDWGANYGPETFGGDFWRVMTSTFLHSGILHLASNMYVLFNIGRIIERLFGGSKFLAIYLLSGLGGSLVSLYVHPQTISVGASGAVFGCFGAFLMMLRAHHASFDKQALRATVRSVAAVLVINLVFGFSHKHIDNSAHIGGFLSGVLAGASVQPKSLLERNWSKENFAQTIFLLGMLLALGYTEYFSFTSLKH